MTPDRIAALLSPFLENATLSESQVAQIATYTDLLMKWNAQYQLDRGPRSRRNHHPPFWRIPIRRPPAFFAEPKTQATAIDVGSGAGFPGLPLKIWNPALDLTLIESQRKKGSLSARSRQTLRFQDVRVLADRAEQVYRAGRPRDPEGRRAL